MKYYQLNFTLPTFERGELFFVDSRGHLISCAHEGIVAYSASTLAKFPDILKLWFKEVPAPERDSKTKYAFMEYLSDHREERFFQAVRNFTRIYLDTKKTGAERPFIVASDLPPTALYEDDTFFWECDEMLKKEDDEEQRADEC